MACNFSIEFSQTPEQLVGMAESAITRAGGKFTGDAVSGSFTLSTGIGSVKGSYVILNTTMNVSIEDKPVFITCDRLETEVRKYLSEGHL